MVDHAIASPFSSPLDGVTMPSGADFAVAYRAGLARFVLRGDPEVLNPLAVGVGVGLPDTLRFTQIDGCSACWLGPDEWLILAPQERAGTLSTNIQSALAGQVYSWVDVTHRQIGLEISGRLAQLALNSGCPLDLDPSAFPAGMVARTLFHKAEIILLREDKAQFFIEIGRSFAPYCLGHLVEAARNAADL